MEQNDDQPGSPWASVLLGVIVGAVGGLLLVLPDAPGVVRGAGVVALAIGVLLAQVGVIAAGVEHGMRRVRGF